MVQLTDELVKLLDQRAARDGTSRSQLIRDAVDAYLRDDREAEIDRQIIEGYRRIPPGTPDEWGDPDAFSDFHSRENLRALAEEERAAGGEPW
jgi:Arc/MetJ-type ribon-helix-helix transcriptional regulator